MNCVGSRVYTTRTAVEVFDAEGVYPVAPTMVQILNGIRWCTTKAWKSHLSVRGGHISSIEYGIDARSLSQAEIQGVLFYQRPEAKSGVNIRLADRIFYRTGGRNFVGDRFGGIELTGREEIALIAPQLSKEARVTIKLSDKTKKCVVATGSLFGSSTDRRI